MCCVDGVDDAVGFGSCVIGIGGIAVVYCVVGFTNSIVVHVVSVVRGVYFGIVLCLYTVIVLLNTHGSKKG